eukprot:COSAG01_NODE_2109_length_8408_cov_33.352870_14_plen_255_part_00
MSEAGAAPSAIARDCCTCTHVPVRALICWRPEQPLLEEAFYADALAVSKLHMDQIRSSPTAAAAGSNPFGAAKPPPASLDPVAAAAAATAAAAAMPSAGLSDSIREEEEEEEEEEEAGAAATLFVAVPSGAGRERRDSQSLRWRGVGFGRGGTDLPGLADSGPAPPTALQAAAPRMRGARRRRARCRRPRPRRRTRPPLRQPPSQRWWCRPRLGRWVAAYACRDARGWHACMHAVCTELPAPGALGAHCAKHRR